MKINFGGVVPISTVDWYGKSAMVIFFNGCPFNCPYCQNYKLLDKVNLVDIEEVENKIIESKSFVSSIVFSGGEATMQSDALEHLAKFAKDLGLLVGIETNGYYPDILKSLIDKELVDKIFLDIKAPLDDRGEYRMLTGLRDAASRVCESLYLTLPNGSPMEVRSTVFRYFPDVLEIAKDLADINCYYVIQQGLPEYSPDGDIRKEMCLSRDELMNIAKSCHWLKDVRIKTRENGEERVT